MTSPPFLQQLVLKLEIGVEAAELVSIHLACFCCWPVHLMHQQFHAAPSDPALLHGFRSKAGTNMT
jgi:hypothetical protein